MKQIVVSAPAKIHLLGEHSVVYGKPAILTAVDKRVSVCLDSRQVTRQDIRTQKIRKIVESVVSTRLNIKKIPPYFVSFQTAFPVGSGLGASAAICAAYIGALLLFLGKKFDKELINSLTYECEKVFHGNPSGADNATVVFGGLIWYRKEFENFRMIQKLHVSDMLPQFVLINSGKPDESTKEMVEMVKQLIQRNPHKVTDFLNKQEALVRQLGVALFNNDLKSMMQILAFGERNLELLGVVGKKAKAIIKEIEKIGGVAKISGAGGVKNGSGMLLCYHNDVDILLTFARKSKLEVFTISFDTEGVKVE